MINLLAYIFISITNKAQYNISSRVSATELWRIFSIKITTLKLLHMVMEPVELHRGVLNNSFANPMFH